MTGNEVSTQAISTGETQSGCDLIIGILVNNEIKT
jgi:hypothetical protein